MKEDTLGRVLGSSIQGAVYVNEPLSRHTSLRIGGPASALVIPQDRADLVRLLRLARELNMPLHVVGQGSNLLVSDKGVDGIVVKTTRLRSVELRENRVRAEAGVLLARLADAALSSNLIGMEFGAAIPGTVGGAVVMNAGVPGWGEFGDVVQRVYALDEGGRLAKFEGSELGFGYRRSCLQQGGYVVTEVELGLAEGDGAEARRRMLTLLRTRKLRQPVKQLNAGSIFKNPPGHSAGRLIEMAGCKGLRVGAAEVSPTHANFIVNKGGARAEHVLMVIRRVREAVYRKTGIMLECEVRFLGFDCGDLRDVV
ncbi:MAG: UDP-N-acetylmuramate dehydrogenase [Candidatus Methanomethylicaceae archaeon]